MFFCSANIIIIILERGEKRNEKIKSINGVNLSTRLNLIMVLVCHPPSPTPSPRILPDVLGGFRAGIMQLLSHAQLRDARVMYGDLAQADLQHLVGKGASFHFLIFIKIEIME